MNLGAISEHDEEETPAFTVTEVGEDPEPSPGFTVVEVGDSTPSFGAPLASSPTNSEQPSFSVMEVGADENGLAVMEVTELDDMSGMNVTEQKKPRNSLSMKTPEMKLPSLQENNSEDVPTALSSPTGPEFGELELKAGANDSGAFARQSKGLFGRAIQTPRIRTRSARDKKLARMRPASSRTRRRKVKFAKTPEILLAPAPKRPAAPTVLPTSTIEGMPSDYHQAMLSLNGISQAEYDKVLQDLSKGVPVTKFKKRETRQACMLWTSADGSELNVIDEKHFAREIEKKKNNGRGGLLRRMSSSGLFKPKKTKWEMADIHSVLYGVVPDKIRKEVSQTLTFTVRFYSTKRELEIQVAHFACNNFRDLFTCFMGTQILSNCTNFQISKKKVFWRKIRMQIFSSANQLEVTHPEYVSYLLARAQSDIDVTSEKLRRGQASQGNTIEQAEDIETVAV